MWVLIVTADGAVPIAHRVEAGNTSDDTTHTATWDGLVALVGRTDFLYVAAPSSPAATPWTTSMAAAGGS